MVHRNTPLSVKGRHRLIERCRTRPISHVAAGVGISRACASMWVNRYRALGTAGLDDHPSTSHQQPTATDPNIVNHVEFLRRDHKWAASRIAFELAQEDITISPRSVSQILRDLGLNQRRFIDSTGDTNQVTQRITARYPGHMMHLDVKKVGRIPNGDGWRAHG